MRISSDNRAATSGTSAVTGSGSPSTTRPPAARATRRHGAALAASARSLGQADQHEQLGALSSVGRRATTKWPD